MYSNLRDQKRSDFFKEAFSIAAYHKVMGIVVAADSAHAQASTNAPDAETDVVQLLLERINNSTATDALSLVIADRPGGGGVPAADAFSSNCLETIREGTNVLESLPRIPLVLTCGSHLLRCLQLSDVFTSCLAAYISGESKYAPQVIPSIRPIIRSNVDQRIGGIGVKIHPDFKYANLYHWLFADEYLCKGTSNRQLPIDRRPYPKGGQRY
jgi:hypothetical protein